MKAKKKIAVLLTLIMVLSLFAACKSGQAEQSSPTEGGSIFDFEDYESDEVFDIKKIDLSDSLAKLCVSYKFTYLSDGLKIKGYLSVPVSILQTQRPGKCVMYNRGGNRDFGISEDDTTAKFCVVCNRIVIASQYRGGGGSEGEDQFGGDDLHDVINLIDLCEKQFTFIDMDDFCVAGASRGGVMTYPAARQDSRIKRIIAMGAITDLIASYEDRDDMKTVLEETIGCTPQENPEEYKKRSAVYWADEIKIPVLMFHGKYDKKVSYEQAEELYEKLRDVTDCTLITYDDDSHAMIHPEDYQTVRDWLNQESE